MKSLGRGGVGLVLRVLLLLLLLLLWGRPSSLLLSWELEEVLRVCFMRV